MPSKRRNTNIVVETRFSPDEFPLLAFNSQYASFVFVHYLNQLYGLHLAHQANICVRVPAIVSPSKRNPMAPHPESVVCPMFSFSDEIRHLLYLLVDVPTQLFPQNSPINLYDKYLFVNGGIACDRVWEIHDELSDRSPRDIDPCDILTNRRNALCDEFCNNGVFMLKPFVGDADIDPCLLDITVSKGTAPKPLERVERPPSDPQEAFVHFMLKEAGNVFCDSTRYYDAERCEKINFAESEKVSTFVDSK